MSSLAAGWVPFLGFLFPAVATPIFTLHIALPGLAGWLRPYDFVFTWAQPLAVLWLVAIIWANYLGARLGVAVQVFLTAVKIISLANTISVPIFSPAPAARSPAPFPAALLDCRTI